MPEGGAQLCSRCSWQLRRQLVMLQQITIHHQLAAAPMQRLATAAATAANTATAAGPGVGMGMYNTEESIMGFAESCFQYALSRKW